VVAASSEPVGVREDGAHAAGDAEMRAQEHDPHGNGPGSGSIADMATPAIIRGRA